MKKQLHYDLMRYALRARICPECSERAASNLDAAEASLPIDPAACESECRLFRNLPSLARMAAASNGEPPCGYRLAVDQLASDPDVPAAVEERQPLLLYLDHAMAVINKVLTLTVRDRGTMLLCRCEGALERATSATPRLADSEHQTAGPATDLSIRREIWQ